MPRKRRGVEEKPRPLSAGLLERLVNELRHTRDSGQPMIDEQEFPSGKVRVTVIWDDWDHLPFEDRTSLILRAYETVEGNNYRERIALASGLTVPEAYAAGMLPYEVFPAVRKTDPVTIEECRQALIDEGASTLIATDRPQLRFATLEEAEAAQQRLIKRLPGSEQVWIVTQEAGKVEEWAGR